MKGASSKENGCESGGTRKEEHHITNIDPETRHK